MISGRDSTVVMAGPASLPGAVRILALLRDALSIESFKGNLLVLGSLRPGRWGREKEQKQEENPAFFQGKSFSVPSSIFETKFARGPRILLIRSLLVPYLRLDFIFVF